MNRHVSTFAFFLIGFASFALAVEIPTAKPEEVGLSSAGLAKVDKAMDGLIAEQKLAGGIVIVARQGKVAHFRSYGLMDVEAKKAMHNEAIMRFYSMSKAVTSVAALILVDEGKLGLDDPVSKYLPELKGLKVFGENGDVAPEQEMTVRDLMRHTAGLSYGNTGKAAADKLFKEANIMDRDSDLAAMTAKLGKLPLAFPPGTDWGYSVSIDVLGRVIEVVAGKPLDAFLNERLFLPLDMKDTGFFVPAEKIERFAANYNTDGKGKLTLGDPPATSPYTKNPKWLSGGGGLVSTGRDYLRFLMCVARGGELDGVRVLSKDSVQLLTTNQLPPSVGWIKFGAQVREGVGFSLGFSVRDKTSVWDPQGRVGEYGWGGAASTHYWVSPKDDLIVITLEQTMPFSFATEFAVKGLIYDAILPSAAGAEGNDPKLFVASPLTKEQEFTSGIEGPACDAAGNVYAVNYGRQGTIGKIAPDGKGEVFVALPEKSVGNGIVFDRQGAMYIADYVGHNVLRVDMTTKQVSVFAHEPAMSQPNDLAIAPDGTLFASDPDWGKGTGRLWRIGTDGKVTLLADKLGTTNGIEVSPDGKTLYVNESVQRNVWAFAIEGDKLGDKRLLKQFEDHGFDGMRCDTEGNLYITRYGKGTVAILSPAGKVLREIDVLGESPSNLCFGGPDGRTVYVTEVKKQRLVQFRVETPGLAWKRRREK